MATDGTSLLHWKELYELAIVELDAAKLPQRIAIAHEAILDRVEETLTMPLGSEHQQLDEALRNLQALRNEIHAWQSKPDRDGEGMRKAN
jgi:hypothetical protein